MSWLLQEDGFRLILEDASGYVLLEPVTVEPAVIIYGGDDAPRTKRKRRRDVFHDMEQTIHALLHPVVDAVDDAPVPVVPAPAIESQLQALLALAGESHGLLQRAGRLRADLAAFEAQQEEARLRADEEDMLMWMD